VGPLGGLEAALAAAVQRGHAGILAVACDMPFLSADLLAHIVATARTTGSDAVLPESRSRRGVEPLTAYYAVNCLPAITAAAERGDHRLIAFHDDIRMTRVPLQTVESFGDPDRLFMNMNTPADRTAADAIVRDE
jgi:molybdopterin-guanine dinucleotide biosynthesis protein A